MHDIKKYSWDINLITHNYFTHSIEQGHEKLKIAIIDSGVDLEHPGLKNNISNTKNFVKNEQNIDYTGHGTMICGQIVGDHIVKGIVPNCKVDMLKVLDKNDSATFSRFIKALEYVYKNNYDVVNMSLGLSINNKSKKDLEYPLSLIKKIHENNTICINSVGYENSEKEHFPSISNYTFTVQSLSRSQKIVNADLFSEFCIPSGDYFNPNISPDNEEDELVTTFFPITKCIEIQSEWSGVFPIPLGYTYSFGESLAAAKLTGIVAAILSRNLRVNNYILPPNEIINLLKKHAKVIDDRYFPNLLEILYDIS